MIAVLLGVAIGDFDLAAGNVVCGIVAADSLTTLRAVGVVPSSLTSAETAFALVAAVPLRLLLVNDGLVEYMHPCPTMAQLAQVGFDSLHFEFRQSKSNLCDAVRTSLEDQTYLNMPPLAFLAAILRFLMEASLH